MIFRPRIVKVVFGFGFDALCPIIIENRKNEESKKSKEWTTEDAINIINPTSADNAYFTMIDSDVTVKANFVAVSSPSNPTQNNDTSNTTQNNDTPRHVHNYVWVVTEAPTAYTKGEMIYQCEGCRHILDRMKLDASSILMTDAIQGIPSAPQGGTVRLDFGNYISINKAFATAHDARADVTMIITFIYKGEHYELMIPAGFHLLPAINEDGWAGFLFIGSFPGATLSAH